MPAASQENLSALVEGVGQETADLVMQHFGGTRLYVTRKLQETHRLCRLLGRDHAQRLIDWAGGASVEIPMRPEMQALHDRIVQQRREGTMTVMEIALANNMSERHVYRIVRKARMEAIG